MSKIKIPTFKSREDRNKFLVEHKEDLITQKAQTIKLADAFGSADIFVPEIEQSLKELTIKQLDDAGVNLLEKEVFTVKAVINSTGIFDSHKDVHLKGCWKKTCRENKRWLHVQEHKSSQFDKIIASGDDLKATNKTISWADMGYEQFKDFEDAEVIHFTSKVRKNRNPYMHEQYAKGYVNNHSVGMRYVWDKLFLGINDEKYEEEYETWEKYKNQIVNIKDAENVGYAWFVAEAKGIEGSAVPLGSNFATPTISAKHEPSAEDTQKEEAEKSLQNIKHYFINL